MQIVARAEFLQVEQGQARLAPAHRKAGSKEHLCLTRKDSSLPQEE